MRILCFKLEYVGWNNDVRTLSFMAKKEIVRKIEQGYYIEAIKTHRLYTGSGLKESKEKMDSWRQHLEFWGYAIKGNRFVSEPIENSIDFVTKVDMTFKERLRYWYRITFILT